MQTGRTGVLDELRAATKTVVVTHEHPDGDALGSLIAMQQVLTALGHDSCMFIAESDLPLPYEYRFLPLDNVISEAPADLDKRTIIFLDCGNIERNPAAERLRPGRWLGPHPQHRPPPRQHSLRHGELRRSRARRAPRRWCGTSRTRSRSS